MTQKAYSEQFYPYIVLGIIALVAVVGLLAGSNGVNQLSVSGQDQLVGQALSDSDSIKIVGWDESGSIQQESETERFVYDDAQFEPEYEEIVLLDGTISTKSSGNGTSNCTVLTQAMIDNHQQTGAQVYIVLDECVEMQSNIDMEADSLHIMGDSSLFCNGYELLGNGYAGITVSQTSEIHDCVVRNREIGFRSFDSSKIFTSLAGNNTFGFRSYGSSQIISSDARHNSVGFLAEWFSIIVDSLAEHNTFGFRFLEHSQGRGNHAKQNYVSGYGLKESSKVFNSVADGSPYNFDLWGDSQVVVSSSKNAKLVGYNMFESSSVERSVSEYDNRGFILYHDSFLFDSSAEKSKHSGVTSSDSSRVENVVALSSDIDGFVAYGNSLLVDVVALNNKRHGIVVAGNSAITLSNPSSHNNSVDGLFVDVGVSLTANGQFCDNGNLDLHASCDSQGQNCAGISGLYTADTYDLGTGYAKVLPCEGIVGTPVYMPDKIEVAVGKG